MGRNHRCLRPGDRLRATKIEPDYFSNFKVDNTSSKENIFVILYDKVYTSQNWWHVFRFHQLTLNSLSQQTYGILDFCWNGFACNRVFL